MGIEEVVTAAHSPWENPYAERLIGSIRRECLDHLIVLNKERDAFSDCDVCRALDSESSIHLPPRILFTSFW